MRLPAHFLQLRDLQGEALGRELGASRWARLAQKAALRDIALTLAHRKTQSRSRRQLLGNTWAMWDVYCDGEAVRTAAAGRLAAVRRLRRQWRRWKQGVATAGQARCVLEQKLASGRWGLARVALATWRGARAWRKEADLKGYRFGRRVVLKRARVALLRWRACVRMVRCDRVRRHVARTLALRRCRGLAVDAWVAWVRFTLTRQAHAHQARRLCTQLPGAVQGRLVGWWADYAWERQSRRTRELQATLRRAVILTKSTFAKWVDARELLAARRAKLQQVVRRVWELRLGSAVQWWAWAVGLAAERRRLEVLRAKSVKGMVRRLHLRWVARTWKQWAQHIRLAEGKRWLCESLLGWQLHRMKRQALRRWLQCVELAAATKTRLQRRRKGAVLSSWINLVEVAQARKASALRRLGFFAKGAALRRWAQFQREQNVAKARVAQVWARARAVMKYTVFNKWAERHGEATAARKHGAHAVLRMLHQAMARTLERWEQHAVERRLLATIEKRIVRRMTHSVIAGAFRQWEQHAVERRLLATIEKRIVRRMTHSVIAGAFRQWEQHAVERRSLATVGKRIVRRMTHSVIAGAFRQWEQHAVERRSLATVGKRIVRRMMHSVLAGAFVGWRAGIWEMRGMRRKSLAVIGRITNMAQAMAWSSWTDFVGKKRLVRMAAQRMLLRVVRSALETWVQHAEKRRSGISVVQRVVQHAKQISMARALGQWICETDERVRRRRKSAVVMSRMMRSTQAAAWTAWAIVVEKRSSVLFAVKRMLLRVKASSWEIWMQRVEEWRASRCLVGRVVRRMLHLTVGQALGRWVQRVERVEEWRASGCLVERWCGTCCTWQMSGGRVVRRMHLAVGQALGRWVQRVEEWRASRCLVERVVRRMMHLMMASALARWRGHTGEIVVARRKSVKVMGRVLNMAVASAWTAWMDFVRKICLVRSTIKRMLLRVKASSWERRKSVKVMGRVLNMAVASAWTAWMDFVRKICLMSGGEGGAAHAAPDGGASTGAMSDGEGGAAHDAPDDGASTGAGVQCVEEWRASRCLVERVVRRMMHLMMGQALGQWKEYVIQLEVCRKDSRDVVNLMLRSSQGRAFAAWTDCVAERRLLRRAVQRQMLHVAAMALGRWAEYILERHSALALGQRVMRRMTHLKLASAIMRWGEAVEMTARLRGLMHRLVRRVEAQAMTAWRNAMQQCQALQSDHVALQSDHVVLQSDHVALVGARLHCLELVKALTAWTAQMQTARQLQRRCMRQVARLVSRTLARGWMTWVRHLRLGQMLRRCGQKLVRRQELQAWNRWSRVVCGQRALRQQARRATLSLLSARVASLFVRWHIFVSRRAWTNAMIAMCTNRYTQQRLEAAYSTWRRAAHRRRLSYSTSLSSVALQEGALCAAKYFIAWRQGPTYVLKRV
ncbi:hypothetical protein CYMTET_33358 [Cymbomonas tetramitiformis]|uniref:Sfi1 spindle body domain-containing protein n=1 Tax=Cymbomonas tetramitiformis TaxID=36881 RepID=A0AAE0FDA5_9CHLO|nr:hypothetical protein CYMTET_33358 [Cymbomonas tetramitiformis]